MGVPATEKRCADCERVRPIERFGRAGHGRDTYCLSCRRVRDSLRRKTKASLPYDQARRRGYKLMRNYGITTEQYDEMSREQGGVCAICLLPETRRSYGEEPRLVVDHNHTTGKVRGLLCASCNGRLAAIDDEQFMLRAKQYVRERDGYCFVGDESTPSVEAYRAGGLL